MNDLWHQRGLAALLSGFARLHLLRTGLELGLFEALEAPLSAEELARKRGLAPDLTAAWLRAAHAGGLLRRERGGVRYECAGLPRWLLHSPESGGLVALIEQALESYGTTFAKLPALLRGMPRPLFGAPAEERRAAEAGGVLERRALRALGKIPGLDRPRRILDVGCGTGSFLVELLRRGRDSTGVGVELSADLAELARQRLDAAGVGRRAHIVVGDFLCADVSKGSFDLALLNNDLYYFAPESRAPLLSRVRSRLRPGGVVAILLPMPQVGALARATGLAVAVASFDLYLRCHANLHGLPELPELRQQLADAEFSETGEVPVTPGGGYLYVWGRVSASSSPRGD
jgi:SAM-dependent methyltransferase